MSSVGEADERDEQSFVTGVQNDPRGPTAGGFGRRDSFGSDADFNDGEGDGEEHKRDPQDPVPRKSGLTANLLGSNRSMRSYQSNSDEAERKSM